MTEYWWIHKKRDSDQRRNPHVVPVSYHVMPTPPQTPPARRQSASVTPQPWTSRTMNPDKPLYFTKSQPWLFHHSHAEWTNTGRCYHDTDFTDEDDKRIWGHSIAAMHFSPEGLTPAPSWFTTTLEGQCHNELEHAMLPLLITQAPHSISLLWSVLQWADCASFWNAGLHHS